MWNNLLALDKNNFCIDFLTRYLVHNSSLIYRFDWFLIFFSLHGMLYFLQLAEDLFRQQTRKLIEENISAALDVLKSRTKAAYDQYHLT